MQLSIERIFVVIRFMKLHTHCVQKVIYSLQKVHFYLEKNIFKKDVNPEYSAEVVSILVRILIKSSV